MFDTEGSDFDTTLHLLADDCEGREEACNNNADPFAETSRIVRMIREGTTHIVVIDGNGGTSGNAVLNIARVTCPAGELGEGEELPREFTITAGQSEHDGVCLAGSAALISTPNG